LVRIRHRGEAFKNGIFLCYQSGQQADFFHRLKDLTKRMERIKAHVRSRVEHVFPLIKDRFHSRKLRYQGLKKNGAQQEVLSYARIWCISQG
jgi:hypothetical protein